MDRRFLALLVTLSAVVAGAASMAGQAPAASAGPNKIRPVTPGRLLSAPTVIPICKASG